MNLIIKLIIIILKHFEEIVNIIQENKGNIYFIGVGKSGNIAKHCADLLKCISYKSFSFDILIQHMEILVVFIKMINYSI
jgi:D-arabinose 5-phosphate isomerase GutQ